MPNLIRQNLKHWADFIKITRAFFDSLGLLEVKTPILSPEANSDVYIDSIAVSVNRSLEKIPKYYYLHTSPELAMKALIAKGSGDIYQICPVFRDNEYGNLNYNEFIMLEWYRLNFDMQQLINEVISLSKILLPGQKVTCLSYCDIFINLAQLDIFSMNLSALKHSAKTYGLSYNKCDIQDLQTMLFIHLIEPKLKRYEALIIYDYPKEQAALARIKNGVAKRFEFYLSGIEIANGYEELQNPSTYKARFMDEIKKRKYLKKSPVYLNDSFLEHIKNGLPPCSGVALGMKRLYDVIEKNIVR